MISIKNNSLKPLGVILSLVILSLATIIMTATPPPPIDKDHLEDPGDGSILFGIGPVDSMSVHNINAVMDAMIFFRLNEEYADSTISYQGK